MSDSLDAFMIASYDFCEKYLLGKAAYRKNIAEREIIADSWLDSQLDNHGERM